MKVLIYFNAPDKPESMGICQLTDNLETFLSERSTILPNAVVYNNHFTFDTFGNEGEITVGYAAIVQVPDTFEN